MKITTSDVAWLPCFRIIPSRFPPIPLFERVIAPEHFEEVIALETMTNARVREEIGDISLVPVEDRISGPGSSVIMAAFTHPNPLGSRFSNGAYGVFYAGREIETAIAETRYHREIFFRRTRARRMQFDMRVYLIDLNAQLHDLRGRQADLPLAYEPDNYGASQHLALELRRQGSHGIVYDSVRHPGGQCAAAFRPRLLSKCRQERHLCYVWDGKQIAAIYEKRPLDT